MNAKNKGASAEDSSALKKLNALYTECLSAEFFPKFLAGENVSVDTVCVDLRNQMLDLDKKVYN